MFIHIIIIIIMIYYMDYIGRDACISRGAHHQKDHLQAALAFTDAVNSCKLSSDGIGFGRYPLVNLQKTMENHHAINGKIHYFNGHFQ